MHVPSFQSLVSMLVVLVLVGLVLWAISAIPILDATVKRLINILVIVVVVLWLLSAFGLLPH